MKYILLLLLTTIPLLLTIFHDVIDIDSSQYAEIAREMALSNDFFQLKDNGKNYLDKPVLTFWTIALSYKIFGISNFAYRIPAILITLFSLHSIYRITYLISSSNKRGILASIAYIVAPGVFAMVIDPKIDVYIVAYLVFTFHAYYLGIKKNSNWFYLMYFFTSMGFITKGPISIVIPAMAIGGDILVRRDWKLLGKMKVFSGIFIVASLPGFWSYILYQEFGSHGPIFFLWVQSFGRFYKEMYNQKLDPLFFISNYSWAFAVFILPLFYTCYLFIRENKKGISFREIPQKIVTGIENNKETESYYVIPIWLFVFLTLISFSRYQLPQYIYWALPAGAIYISKFLEDYLSEKSRLSYNRKIFSGLLIIVPVIFLVSILLIPFLVIEVNFYYPLIAVFFILSLIYFSNYISLQFSLAVITPTLFFSIVSIFVYPELISYQPSHKIGSLIKSIEPDKKEIFTYRIPFSKRSYGFYSERLTRPIFDKDRFVKLLQRESDRLVVVPKNDLIEFKSWMGNDYLIQEVVSFPSYKVATPKNDFFIKRKRMNLTKDILLIRIKYAPGSKLAFGAYELK